MHGKGVYEWPYGRKYTGVMILVYCRNMKIIKRMAKVFLNGLIVGHIQDFGYKVKLLSICFRKITWNWNIFSIP